MKRAAILIVAAVVLAAVIGGFAWFQFVVKPEMVRGFITAAPQPVPAVTAQKAEMTAWQPRLPAIGTLRAVSGIDVAPEVAGRVSAIRFESGRAVDKGAVLVQLDDAVEQADLKSGLADLRNAELTLGRQRELLTRGNTSKTSFDAAVSRRDIAAASIERTRALIEQKKIEAPFAGRLGIRQVDLGAYVSPGTTLVTLQQLTPIYVDFSLPEQHIDDLALGQTVEVLVDTYPGRKFVGTLDSIDARVDQDTRNILVRAKIPNPDAALLPGMFANVAVIAGAAGDFVTVPRTAVTYSLYGDSVYVVKQEPGEDAATVERRFVRTGDVREDRVAILEGVAPGEVVVTSGQLKLQPGGNVQVDPEARLQPPAVRPRE